MCIYQRRKTQRSENIREISVPAVSAAGTVDTWTAFTDPRLVLRLRYFTGLCLTNDL